MDKDPLITSSAKVLSKRSGYKRWRVDYCLVFRLVFIGVFTGTNTITKIKAGAGAAPYHGRTHALESAWAGSLSGLSPTISIASLSPQFIVCHRVLEIPVSK